MQKTVALSSAEAEYYAASEMAIERIYLSNLLINMCFDPAGNTPVYEDNIACIKWANNVIGGRELAKHIDIQKHFAHEAVQNGHIRLVRVSTDRQLADVFTKSLHTPQFTACVSGIQNSS
jgi:hypothetical protein